ncbi:BrnT family toxin [Alphaproteobacteria bacterium LSUCC0684]
MDQRGIDFADAERLDWDQAMTGIDDRGDYGETRFITIAPIDDDLYVMAWVQRKDRVRIISLRKANSRERTRYGQTIHR